MVEILSAKEEIFDDYARRSELSDGTPEAIDVSEARLARVIIAEEQERLSRESTSDREDYETEPDES